MVVSFGKLVDIGSGRIDGRREPTLRNSGGCPIPFSAIGLLTPLASGTLWQS